MTKEQQIIEDKIKMNWIKIKRLNEILEKTDQVINNFKKYIKEKYSE